MDSDDKVEFLARQIHALIGFAAAVIMSHPKLDVLTDRLEARATPRVFPTAARRLGALAAN